MLTNPTTSLTGDLRQGDLQNILRLLQSEDIRLDDFLRIAEVPDLRAKIVKILIESRPIDLTHLFSSPEEQIQRLLEINYSVWFNPEISETAIRALGEPPVCPPSDEEHLYCTVLLYDTGDAFKTFQNNWKACKNIISCCGCSTFFRFNPMHIRLHKDAKPRNKGIRWAICELGRFNRNVPIVGARLKYNQSETMMGIGPELPLIAAMHPKWPMAMDGKQIPELVTTDLEMTPLSRMDDSSKPGNFGHVLHLSHWKENKKMRVYLDYFLDTVEVDKCYGAGYFLI